MTTTQPILILRHVYEPAVQLCKTDSVVSAMADPTLSSPHYHLLRKGACAGLESRSNPSSPTTCCSQGKVRLPLPFQPNTEYRQLLEGSDSEAKAFRENARSYNNALSFTSLAAHWDQTKVGTLGPPVFRVFGRLCHRLSALIPAVNQRPAFAQTWLIDPAEATDTRLGPDGAGSRMLRSTLTKLESILRTGNRFYGNGDAYLPTPTQGIVDRKTLFSSSLHPSAMPLRYPLLFPAGEDGFHPNIPPCGFHQAGPPIARNREQIDNGVQLRELLAGLSLDEEDEEEDDEDEVGKEDDEENDDGEPSFPLEFVIDGYSQVEIDRLNCIRLHQEKLRLTTAQGFTDGRCCQRLDPGSNWTFDDFGLDVHE
ncbi:BQ5605_C002g01041 [Microbotryum silenes-dioicae]|uniref:BQ5605_C002g01041 protein n=1 Tax=Microbotryum silenes-dioicae TaxID=796604 RepID=A0A2X0M1H2_9BASI|nr:BQ5605_C002g01041 [Microbotryum silenes-dioicae]